MGEPRNGDELTAGERHVIVLLRQGPQSVTGVAEALRLSLEQAQVVIQRLQRTIGLVPLFRYDTLRHGLAE
jgi:hypothetical protein